MSHPRSQSGVSLAEYGLILACVVCLCIAALQSLGSRVSGNIDAIAKKINTIKVVPSEGPTIRVAGTAGMPCGYACKTDAAPPERLGAITTGPITNPYPSPGIAGTAGTRKRK